MPRTRPVGWARPRMRFVFNPPVRMPDQPAPLPAGMPRGERFGPDLIDVVTARWLAPDDPPGALDRVGVVNPVASMADSDLAAPPVMTPRPAGLSGDRLG